MLRAIRIKVRRSQEVTKFRSSSKSRETRIRVYISYFFRNDRTSKPESTMYVKRTQNYRSPKWLLLARSNLSNSRGSQRMAPPLLARPVFKPDFRGYYIRWYAAELEPSLVIIYCVQPLWARTMLVPLGRTPTSLSLSLSCCPSRPIELDEPFRVIARRLPIAVNEPERRHFYPRGSNKFDDFVIY